MLEEECSLLQGVLMGRDGVNKGQAFPLPSLLMAATEGRHLSVPSVLMGSTTGWLLQRVTPKRACLPPPGVLVGVVSGGQNPTAKQSS